MLHLGCFHQIAHIASVSKIGEGAGFLQNGAQPLAGCIGKMQALALGNQLGNVRQLPGAVVLERNMESNSGAQARVPV